jgi:hypothetical protein
MGLSFFELKETDFDDDQVREFLHSPRETTRHARKKSPLLDRKVEFQESP